MNTIIGIDIGYGYTKAVSAGRSVTQPSLIGPAVTVKYHSDLISNGHGLRLDFPGQAWFLGELARLQSPFTISPRARERDPELLRVLLCGACYELGVLGGAVRIVTGLPVSWYADRAALVQAIAGRYAFAVNGQPVTLDLADVLVIPQPFGALFRVLLNPAGVLVDEERLARERVAVLDIGTHTTDYAFADQLRYIEPKSGSTPVAMARVYELVRRAIAEEHNLDLNLPEVEEAVRRGYVTLYGQRYPLGDLATSALDAVAQEILGEARTLWGDGRDLAAVLVTGGGGLTLLERIKAVYPHARLVPNPQAANAEGFYRYALRKFGEVGVLV